VKLRLQANSVRLRLKQGEVDRLVEKGTVEESIRFFPGGEMLSYRLELSDSATIASARFQAHEIVVELPASAARKWAADPAQVSLEALQPPGADAARALAILVEKDFACLDGTDEQNADTFPHPLAGTKC
jgi:hypothetical protein